MVGWHHQLSGHEFEETPGDSEGQGSLVCCSSWGCRVGHNSATKQQYQSIECINPLKCFLKAQPPYNQGIVSTMAARDHSGREGAGGRNNLLVRLTPPGDPAPKSAPLRQLGLFFYIFQILYKLPSFFTTPQLGAVVGNSFIHSFKYYVFTKYLTHVKCCSRL